MNWKVIKKIVGLLGVITVLIILLYYLGSLVNKDFPINDNKVLIERLENDNYWLIKENDLLTLEIDMQKKKEDSLELLITKIGEEITEIKREKDEKVNSIGSYDVDALYEFFTGFDTTSEETGE